MVVSASKNSEEIKRNQTRKGRYDSILNIDTTGLQYCITNDVLEFKAWRDKLAGTEITRKVVHS